MSAASDHSIVRIGVIADTHNLLRPAALSALQGSDHIIHAGDIGKPEILERLREIAPLTVVRGNNDTDDWAQAIPETAELRFGDVHVYLIHILKDLMIDPAAEGIRVVICGHSHKPKLEERGGVLYFNPGSPGPRRFKLPLSLGRLTIQGSEINAELITLDV
ncbi:metallophosphoesterase family protein [Pseudomonas asuensis]|uniref:Phosphoesterase n=1 Tax=Pseudomonas asuensis TaxID=1825787 RepID=A0ABQ2GUN5_9PSED|nr:metallophosphoesterase family protein [Pseudomonas asuensis]GGM12676.1 phosphoesterase [Pseudomonas asuensis]